MLIDFLAALPDGTVDGLVYEGLEVGTTPTLGTAGHLGWGWRWDLVVFAFCLQESDKYSLSILEGWEVNVDL